MDRARSVARALLDIGVVGFSVDNPITFVSGIKAPMYVDNRKLPFHPAEWRTIIDAFKEEVGKLDEKPDVIAGVEAAGIPHSSALGFALQQPSVFVRKKPKGYGMNKRVEGGDVQGKRVLLVEDLVTMGQSSLNAVAALREEGALVSDVIVIVTYGFPESATAFREAQVSLHALTSFSVLIEEAIDRKLITAAEAQEILSWSHTPRAWRN